MQKVDDHEEFFKAVDETEQELRAALPLNEVPVNRYVLWLSAFDQLKADGPDSIQGIRAEVRNGRLTFSTPRREPPTWAK